MPSCNTECFCKEESGGGFFQDTADNLVFPNCYKEVSSAMATVRIKSFLWSLTYEREYLFRKNER